MFGEFEVYVWGKGVYQKCLLHFTNALLIKYNVLTTKK